MGRIEDAAKAELAAAQAKIDGAQSKKDLEVRATHFIGDGARGYTLRNDSTDHGSTLTDDEYAAVQAILAGKKEPASKDGRFKDGGSVAVAQDVARVAASLS